MSPLDRGYVHVYTGNGKGKTTAALGLALRAAGAGLRVFFAQFVKGRPSSEDAALARYDDLITLARFGRGCFIRGKPAPADVAAARRGLEEAATALRAGDYDVVVLDEANTAVHCGLFSADDLLALVDSRPEGVEVVITGRKAHPKVRARADLLTEMRDVRHYLARGVKARAGIEE